MAIHESGEDYLEAILIITRDKGFARSIDVANFMGVSKPSVSRAMSVLRAEGCLDMEKDGRLVLTKAGSELAGTILERHVFISEFLVSLGVDRHVAVKDACRIEHVLSDETYEKLREHARKHIEDKEERRI